MTILHALAILALASGQAGVDDPAAPAGPPAPQAPPQQLRLSEPRMIPLDPPDPQAPPQQLRLSEPRLIPLDPPDPQAKPPPMVVPDGAPALRLDRPSRCFERPGGGRWRAQCDAGSKRCLVAPDAELSAEGEPVAGLDRVAPCLAPGWREADLVAQGYAVAPALAETPAGWQRDERQRIMQVNFDLNRRMWLGAGYGAGGFPWSDAGEATAGIRWDVPFRVAGAPALARVRALETFARFDGDMVDFTAIGVDASRAYPSPLLRFTTFVGRPRRFDPPLYLGGWLEAVRVESLRTDAGWYDRTGLGAAALTLDLWRSQDLASFVRLRLGAGYELAEQLDGAAWVPHAAADADLSLDRGGFHHLRLAALAERLLTTGANDYQPKDPAAPSLPDDRVRYTARAEYEVVFAAVNDQPISAVLDVRAQRRNDVPGLSSGWHAQGTASLRFNLWAPPRRDAPVQERL